MSINYDLIVVGAGHAGCEAAYIASKMGSKVLFITMDMNTIAQMSCNPAMGGIAKGQIIREIDALGGMSGIISDKSMIQFRMLNRSKGPAMWSPRTQNDRRLFSIEWRKVLEQSPNIDFWQEMVSALIVENGRVKGVKTTLGLEFKAKSVVLTNGTFLNGIIHIGEKQFGGGRISEHSATGLTEQLVELGFESGRMKTGTPPRVDGRSLNYELMEEQKGDENPYKFSFSKETKPLLQQRSCFITYTNEEVHDILRTGFDRSPIFSGRIEGVGPRYCPSIEDKIERFAERNRHQIFVEPEGWNTVEVYVNGFSTSLPYEVQYEAIRKIVGFENVKMFRPGYAIEYDYFPPVQLYHSLETKLVENLFFAGQINGTTGYEEAACQGLIAGMNAHLKIHKQEPFVLSRAQAYIGVLIDDLINKGTKEPYRMFTSRAEYRILLRQSNADIRLSKLAHGVGAVSDDTFVLQKEKNIASIIKHLKNYSLAPEVFQNFLLEKKSEPLKQKTKSDKLIKRPNISVHELLSQDETLAYALRNFTTEEIEEAEIIIKYESYIEKERVMAARMEKLDTIKLIEINYEEIKALSNEAVEKLNMHQPIHLGQASQISGISPSDIAVLLAYLGKKRSYTQLT